MRILLLAGTEHSYIIKYVEKMRHTVVNKDELNLGHVDEYLQNNSPIYYDGILITDDALSSDPDENERILEILAEHKKNVFIVTRDFFLEFPNDIVKVMVSNWFRATYEDFKEVLKQCKEEAYNENVEMRKKKWGVKPRKTSNGEEPLMNADIDRTSSRVIVFSGHRGSGVTSTAVSVALSANRRNLKTIFLDLDTDYRTANLYFGEFARQADEEDCISASLIRLLAQPQKYDTLAVNIDGMWIASLGYDFDDEKLLQQHFTESKIIGLITSLKHNFDLVIVDFPMDRLANVPALLNSVDSVALCIENNIYSAFTTVRNIVVSFGDGRDIPYFASKAKLVATKFNDESTYDGEPITPERLSELIVNEGFCEDFTVEMPVVGSVAYDKRFDRQIESDISIIHTDNSMKQAYDSILLRLLGAVR